MATLQEIEILDRLKSSLREAADQADRLAKGERGRLYPQFRENMKLIWGCCRQMTQWRFDSRWGVFGNKVKDCQERCRRWLVEKHGPAMYKKLAEQLRFALKQATDLETMRTGKRGAITPRILTPDTRTQGRQILVPPGFKDIRETVH
jgi:hypothetical protein